MRYYLPFCLLLFFTGLFCDLNAQNATRLMRIHEKGDFAKTRELIAKSLEKDTINPAAYYLNSILFMIDPFRQNTDSARWYIDRALAQHKTTVPDIIEELGKAQITVDSLKKQKLIVTDYAFDKAKSQSSVYAMDFFLEYYPDAPQKGRAIFIRDSLAYDNANDQNTWQGYRSYLDDYPESVYYDEANKKYQRLLYLDKTLDNRLRSYKRFLSTYPDTPHRNEIERVILRRSTVDHEWESYTNFLSQYPNTQFRKKVTDILYHKDKLNYFAQHDELLGYVPNADSVQEMKSVETHLLIPFYTDGRYGFMNSRGDVILENEFATIEKSYFCGAISNEWLKIAEDGINVAITRAGVDIMNGFTSYEALGAGVLLVESENGKFLHHKSGFQIIDQAYQDANVIGDKFIKVKKDNNWGLISMLGLKVLEEKYESIEMEGAFLIVNDGDHYSTTNISRIAEQVENLSVETALSFEDYEVFGDSLLLTFNDDQEALYDHELNVVIPEMEHQIFIVGSSWYVKSSKGYQIYNRNSEELIDQVFPYIDVNNGWLAIRRADDWLLISQHYKVLPIPELDSIRLINDYTAFVQKNDTLQLIFNSGEVQWLEPEQKLMVLTSRENTDPKRPEYVMVYEEDLHKVFSSEGMVLFEGEFEQLDFLTDSLFIFKSKGKYGLMHANGKAVLSPKYESINRQEDLILLLNDGKIGGYNPRTGSLIPPEYESRPSTFGRYFVIAKEGKIGMINSRNEEVIPFEYEEFMPWNDTSLLARDSTLWDLITYDHEIIESGLMNPEVLAEWGREKFLKVMKDQSVGLLNNREGEILETVYNDIVNIGTNNQPVFFAEQHLQTAAFFVVTYFDRWGEILRSQAYRPEEYSKIYCDQ